MHIYKTIELNEYKPLKTAFIDNNKIQILVVLDNLFKQIHIDLDKIKDIEIIDDLPSESFYLEPNEKINPAKHSLIKYTVAQSKPYIAIRFTTEIKEILSDIIEIWNLETKQRLHIIDCSEFSTPEQPFCFNPQGNMLAAGFINGDIKIWDINSDKEIAHLKNKETITALSFLPNQPNILASGSEYGNIRLWDIHTGKVLKTFKDEGDWVSCISFSNDSTLMAAGWWLEKIKIWDLKSGECIYKIDEGIASSLSFSSDNKKLVVGFQESNGAVKSYDLENKKEIAKFECENMDFGLNAVSFSPQEDFIVSLLDSTRHSSNDNNCAVKIFKIK